MIDVNIACFDCDPVRICNSIMYVKIEEFKNKNLFLEIFFKIQRKEQKQLL